MGWEGALGRGRKEPYGLRDRYGLWTKNMRERGGG